MECVIFHRYQNILYSEVAYSVPKQLISYDLSLNSFLLLRHLEVTPLNKEEDSDYVWEEVESTKSTLLLFEEKELLNICEKNLVIILDILLFFYEKQILFFYYINTVNLGLKVPSPY